VRTDSNLARRSFRFSEEWRRRTGDAPLTPQIDRRLQGGREEDGRYVVHSLSGMERNHFFANRDGKTFSDLSLISGIDNPADSRGFVLLDYDHDGWQDLALVNANEPLFSIYRNQMGEAEGKADHHVIAIRFEGGARGEASPNESYACRDGYGALVTADLGDLTIKREHRCGEGYSVQNSRTMVIGIGSREKVSSLTVRWPSGKTATQENVAAGTLLIAYENPTHSGASTQFTLSNYHDVVPRKQAPAPLPLASFPIAEPDATAPIRVYTTMATWCVACQSHLPQLQALKNGLGEGAALIGIPIDPDDNAKMLTEYAEEWKPAYRIRADLESDARAAVTRFLAEQSGEEAALPSTIITNAEGKVLKVMSGVPDVSMVRKLAAGP
jgi:thiol-disulfide isomerase/thioredoxin